jgi:hypothetical protein
MGGIIAGPLRNVEPRFFGIKNKGPKKVLIQPVDQMTDAVS